MVGSKHCSERHGLAAQTFILWSRLGVWERLPAMTQERSIGLGMAFLDGTSNRAHAKAAGASKKERQCRSGTSVRRLTAPSPGSA